MVVVAVVAVAVVAVVAADVAFVFVVSDAYPVWLLCPVELRSPYRKPGAVSTTSDSDVSS